MDEIKTPAPLNGRINLKVKGDKRTVAATVLAPQHGGRNPTVPEIMDALREAGVVFGIKESNVSALARSNDYGRAELLAEAELPVKGKDASLKYHFTVERELRPRELPDGSVDFKDLGLVTNIAEGTVLVTKTPAEDGVPGTNVMGEPIPAAAGRDVPLPAGSGTKISEDGLQLLAAMQGQANIVHRRVTISDILTISQDVGVATGNIDFIGNVRIIGNISAGFKVKATGTVTVNGILDGGSVEAGGHVSIDNGFNGMEKGEIISGGDVRCKFFQNGKVSAKGSVHTGVIIGCTVRSGEKLSVTGSKSRIYSSALSARDTISCVNVGTDGHSKPVILEVGSDPDVIARKNANPKERAEAEKKLQGIEQLYAILTEREKRGVLPADKLKDYENIKSTREHLQGTIAALEFERVELEEKMATMGFGNIIIAGNIKQGTHIVIGPEHLILDDDNKFVRYRRVQEQGIVSGPAK